MKKLELAGVSVMDLHQVLQKEKDLPALFIDHIHFTADGHAVIGERLGNVLLPLFAYHQSDSLSSVLKAKGGN